MVTPETPEPTSPPPVPQPILTPLTEAAIFLVVTVEPGAKSESAICWRTSPG